MQVATKIWKDNLVSCLILNIHLLQVNLRIRKMVSSKANANAIWRVTAFTFFNYTDIHTIPTIVNKNKLLNFTCRCKQKTNNGCMNWTRGHNIYKGFLETCYRWSIKTSCHTVFYFIILNCWNQCLSKDVKYKLFS